MTQLTVQAFRCALFTELKLLIVGISFSYRISMAEALGKGTTLVVPPETHLYYFFRVLAVVCVCLY